MHLVGGYTHVCVLRLSIYFSQFQTPVFSASYLETAKQLLLGFKDLNFFQVFHVLLYYYVPVVVLNIQIGCGYIALSSTFHSTKKHF